MTILKKIVAAVVCVALLAALPVWAAGGGSKYFTDVEQGWAVEAVDALYDNGVVIGVGDECYAPLSKILSGQFALVLWRLAGGPEVDVDTVVTVQGSALDSEPKEVLLSNLVVASGCYRDATLWAADNAYLKLRIPDGGSPIVVANSSIFRGDIIEGLFFFANSQGLDVTPTREVDLENEFTDWNGYSKAEYAGTGLHREWGKILPEGSDKCSEWDIWSWAVSTGIIEGYENDTLGMKKAINRAEFATIIHRFMQTYPQLTK